MTHDSTAVKETQVLDEDKTTLQSSQNGQTVLLDSDDASQSPDVNDPDLKQKISYNCFLLMSNTKLVLNKESACKGGIKATFLPEGWAYASRKDAKIVAARFSKGKRKVSVIPWYNPLINDLWHGTKEEEKLAKKKIALEINQNKNNEKLRRIESDCEASGLHRSWLHTEVIPDDMLDKEKQAFEKYNSLWNAARDEKDEVELQQHDINLIEEDLKESLSKSDHKYDDSECHRNGIKIPYGYQLNNFGVWKESAPKKKKNQDPRGDDEDENEPILTKICDPIWVAGRSRDYLGSNSGLIIRWIDMDGITREACIERRKLHTQGNEIAIELAHDNLAIVPGMETELKKYLSGFKPDKTYRAVKSLGWFENPLGDLLYVSKKHTFRNNITSLNEEIIFQPETISTGPSPLECMGTLKQWKENIAIPCRGNAVPIFLQSHALSGLIVKFADTGSNGVHISGNTSKGKTTAAQTSTSTTGCGADPTYAPKLSLIRRWHATANAIESLASQATDSALCLDEIGQCVGSDLDKVIYNLFGGRGKERLTQQSKHKTTRDWCTTVISTGEKSLQERLAETNSKAPAGLFVRFIDIPVEQVFTDYHGENNKTFIDNLKRNCGQFYGTAASAFIQKIVDTYKSSQELRESIAKGCLSIAMDISGGITLSQEHSRVLKLFCFATLTGIWASEWEIFPYTRDEILDSTKHLFAKWHEGNKKQGEDVRCICAIRDYYLKKRDSAFRPCDLQDRDARRFSDVYGYTTGLGKFYLTKEGLHQALGELPKKPALKALFDKGYLLREENPHRNESKKTIEGIKVTPRVFVISEEICGFDGEIA